MAKTKVFYLSNYKLQQWGRVEQKPGDACFDLRAAISEKLFIYPHDVVRVPLGMVVELPEYTCMKIYPRSGCLAVGLNLTVPQIIDPSYRGEIHAVVRNVNEHRIVIEPGDRIAQGNLERFIPAEFDLVRSVDDLTKTWRGANGFGHTGVK